MIFITTANYDIVITIFISIDKISPDTPHNQMPNAKSNKNASIELNYRVKRTRVFRRVAATPQLIYHRNYRSCN